MKASLCCEEFRYDCTTTRSMGRRRAMKIDFGQPKFWVAEIIGRSVKYGYARRFLSGRPDYTLANSVGSRGIYWWYILESGRHYEVFRQTTWKSTERFFCTVDVDGKITRRDKCDIEVWLDSCEDSGILYIEEE